MCFDISVLGPEFLVLGLYQYKRYTFGASLVAQNLPANAGDTGSSPGLGRSHMLRSN